MDFLDSRRYAKQKNTFAHPTTIVNPIFGRTKIYMRRKPSSAREKHILGDSIHPLARQFQANLQQFLRDFRLSFLHFRPRSLIEEPGYTVTFCGRRAGALRSREEREFAARRSFDNQFCKLPLLQVIFCLQYALFQKVKAIGRFAAAVQDTSGRVSFADEIRHCAAPERFGLCGYGGEGLEDELNGLLVFLPLGDRRGSFVLIQRRGCYLTQMVSARRAEHRLAREGWVSLRDI